MRDLNAILQAMSDDYQGPQSSKNEKMPELMAQSTALALQDAYESYRTDHGLRPGDLIEWKPGMGIYKAPNPGEPAILVRLLSDRVESGRDTGDPYAAETLDCVFGVFCGPDKDFVMYYGSTHRFQPFVQKDL